MSLNEHGKTLSVVDSSYANNMKFLKKIGRIVCNWEIGMCCTFVRYDLAGPIS